MEFDPKQFEINDQDIKTELVKISGEYAHAIYRLTVAKVNAKKAEYRSRQVRSQQETQLRAQMEQLDMKVTESRIKTQLDLVPAVEDADQAALDREIEQLIAQGVVECFAKKKDLLISLNAMARSEMDNLKTLT